MQSSQTGHLPPGISIIDLELFNTIIAGANKLTRVVFGPNSFCLLPYASCLFEDRFKLASNIARKDCPEAKVLTLRFYQNNQ